MDDLTDVTSPKEAPPSRRLFLFSMLAAIAGGLSLLATLGSQILRYIFGPRLSLTQQVEMISEQQTALQAEIKFNDLKLQRITKSEIPIANIYDLEEGEGKLYTDYSLRPGVVFKTSDNTAIARSAVCTHLGCTVQTSLAEGKIRCACHNSYFDLKTGKALSGPATEPLPEEPIVIRDDVIYLIKPDPVERA